MALVVLRIRARGELAGGLVPRVPAGHVGRKAAELLGGAAGLVGVGELLSAGLKVGVPCVTWKLVCLAFFGRTILQSEEVEGGGGLIMERTAKPATVTSIEIHDHVRQVQILDGIRDTGAVARGGGLACGEVGVGDQVGQGVRLDDEGKRRVGVFLDQRDDGVDVLGLVAGDVASSKLAV